MAAGALAPTSGWLRSPPPAPHPRPSPLLPAITYSQGNTLEGT